ncbi:MAG: DUF4058 family protein [Planctomycetia bacterium]|nr:DUF4058 family protein [Planctomycetia bacterium]
MPLLDHFHPPLYPQRTWESFHSRWANSIADELHRVLPKRFFVEVQTHLGSEVETDIAEFERLTAREGEEANGAAVGIAVQTWSPPAATHVLPGVFPDDIEVQVRDSREDARLVGVIELVSPRNKDRPDARRAFAIKSLSYLQRGPGVVVLDIVTSGRANLHNEMIQLLGLDATCRLADDVSLYAVSYGPVRRQEQNQIDVWTAPLALGAALPLLPLVLKGYAPVPLDLDAAYRDACERSRL